MTRERQVRLLNAATLEFLSRISGASDLHNLLETFTRLDERTFTGDGYRHRPWPLLPLIICEAVSGNFEKAIPAAAMIQLLNAAAELLDDIEDADASDDSLVRRNPAVAVNAATALVVLAQTAIIFFKSYGVSERKAMKVVDTINSYYTTACLGQHADLTLSPEVVMSEETYLEIAYRKSASTIEGACHAGALLANSNRVITNEFRNFGRNIGLSGQIANDIQGIIDGRDVLSGKITLPMIFALNHVKDESLTVLQKTYGKLLHDEIDAGRIKDVLFNCGAIQYAVIQMTLYRNKASETVVKLGKTGIDTEQLEEFLK